MTFVDWIDHFGQADDLFRDRQDILDRVKEPVVIRTHGIILYEDKDKIVMVSEERLDADLVKPLYRQYMVIRKKLVIGRGE